MDAALFRVIVVAFGSARLHLPLKVQGYRLWSGL
jgi:hypothetical protein